MKDFSRVHFNGKFRDYQQGVLDRAHKHLKDKKIHIVAAPGSGKTVLGLELLCRLKSPALVLSPGVTIRQQWGERFAEKFLPETEKAEDYVSYDLKSPALITSITYQALHAAVTKQTLTAEEDEETEQAESGDFTDFDIYTFLSRNGIKTICLDEAHHLKSEWQRALESFIGTVQGNVTVISLTATPPYDSTPAEWNRYISLCGDIDEEIFVPQLIAQKNLCPHQDFIFFSYPTEEEASLSEEYKIKGVRTAESILRSPLLKNLLTAAKADRAESAEKKILENMSGFKSLFVCASYVGLHLPKENISTACGGVGLPVYTVQAAENAFNFVLEHPEIFTKELCEELRCALAQNGLIDKKKVCLISTEAINKQLVASLGKLDSIKSIVASEWNNLGENLRLLVLTDYIKQDLLKAVGTEEKLDAMGAVPVFEAVRRSVGEDVRLAMLSGTLVIVPNVSREGIDEIAEAMQIRIGFAPIENTAYSRLTVSGSNKNKVALITEALQRGLIHVLVGTKALLGEGWDSPCINSLILASFVGSFMLSNQMRGRAIRTDRNDTEKVSNIWHLATVEPTVKGRDSEEQMLFDKVLYNDSYLFSNDFDTLRRRFNCFLAPAYHSAVIESGMDRIDNITAPFDRAGIDRINNQMLSLAADRRGTAEAWFAALKGNQHPEILDVVEIRKPQKPKKYSTRKAVSAVLWTLLAVLLGFFRSGMGGGIFGRLASFVFLIAIIVFAIQALRSVLKALRYKTPEKTVQTLANAVLKALLRNKMIENRNAAVEVKAAMNGTEGLYCMLKGGSAHDKKVFSACMSEMLCSPEEPRYVLVQNGLLFKNYDISYACPSALGTKKETVLPLVSALGSSGKFVPYYTKNEAGHTELLRCRKKSYINAGENAVSSKKVVICG